MPNNKFKETYRIESTRHPFWDYASHGAYFVTICAKNKEPYFGTVVETQCLVSPQEQKQPNEQWYATENDRIMAKAQYLAPLREHKKFTEYNYKIQLSEIGKIAFQYWNEIPKHFPFVTLDEFIIMPDHIHGILIFDDSKRTIETQHFVSLPPKRLNKSCVDKQETQNVMSSLQEQKQSNKQCYATENDRTKVETQYLASLRKTNKFGPQSKNLASVIRGFKSAVKTFATKNAIDFQWQPRFYDRIVRNAKEFQEIRKYIHENPAKWFNHKIYN